MEKIAIQGFYGEGNLGDEAILKALLQELGSISKKTIIFSRKPEILLKQYGIKSVHSRSKRDFLRRIWELKTSDLFLLGGGGIIKDYGSGPSSLKSWLKLLILAQKMKVKTALFCVGVENVRYEKSKRLLKNVLSKVDLICVRDSYSKQLLNDFGIKKEIKIVADPAIILVDSNPGQIKDTLKPCKVVICVRHWFDKGFHIENKEANENLMRTISKGADYLIERYEAKIDFIPFRTIYYDDDRAIAKEIVSTMKYKKNAYIYSNAPSVDEFIFIAKQSTLIVGMRLHSLILGAAVGIPIIGLEYMHKVRGFMEELDQKKYSLEMETITPIKLVSLIKETFDNYNARSKKITSEISKMKIKLNHAFINIAELPNKNIIRYNTQK